MNNISSQITQRAISQATRDMAAWRTAKRQALNADNPKRVKLIELYHDIYQDPLLTSQIEQRIERSMATPWHLIDAQGTEHEEGTTLLRQSVGFADVLWTILETPYWGHSLVELYPKPEGQDFSVTLIPRQNVIPAQGKMLFDITADATIQYRRLKEYGTYILEFGDNDDLGLLNQAVPMALFKRFATRCWSELCEIYGIPPRYLKTDTTNPDALARAEEMMRDIGSAAWFIIDTTEEFQFAQGINTNGDVYRNAIACYNSEISLLISGAQLGQDTANGNRSKEEVGVELLEKKAAADRRVAESLINSRVLPALARLGIIAEGLRFEFEAEQDDKELWQRTVAVLPYYEVDAEWIRNTFGIEVTGKKEMSGASLSLPQMVGDDFFD